ncbi:carbohydrate ABC transporter permease [Listeria ivanovii]|uniref:Carbohydrate ABC transporter permease n=2 Tax=Listeria ivanovii TaxID=1638 RepID=A0ABS1G691_LISIV|nr:carbohydrate ABC transporter permease [Listeria ivanovii]AIS60138.1 sugar ABC transporter permease [Listeria ivanovii subsp. londoniensis]AIS62964.1 sugar ABC transporter permease [Listeria ivanovii subsp. londoniensis]MBC2256206.1 carbohydrate ABC transporter permease [Listeria ivanovii]MBK1962386.1 carbohydrate ABC transporter permease [Listeria ivanovii subsp. londoniensis]MBK1967390.1 carbohydrate ABC transporter permease [Listeria ivanovii subsp. londoniensis]
MNQYTQKSRGAKIAVITILTVGGFFMILPFIWMVLSSLKTDAEILKIPPTIWPETFTLDNFTKLFTEMDFAVYLKNTLIIVFFSFFGLFLNAMAGYGFAKFKFKGKNKLFYLVLATMMIPGQVTMIPVYLLLNAAGLTNTMTGIVLPGLVGAFGIFLFRQFMSTISDDLLEAARLDGASEFYIFWRIIIPISRPVLAVQGILTFIAGWNSFLWPLIIANDEKFYTLSVGLQLLKGQYGSNYALQMAGATFMVIPIILIFMIFQKYILKGFNVSGMK